MSFYFDFSLIKSLESRVLPPPDQSRGLCTIIAYGHEHGDHFSVGMKRTDAHAQSSLHRAYGSRWEVIVTRSPATNEHSSRKEPTVPRRRAQKQDVKLGASCCEATVSLITEPSCRLKMFYMRASGGWVLCSLSVGVWNSHIWTHLLPENRAIWPFAGWGFNEETVIFFLISVSGSLSHTCRLIPPTPPSVWWAAREQ